MRAPKIKNKQTSVKLLFENLASLFFVISVYLKFLFKVLKNSFLFREMNRLGYANLLPGMVAKGF